MSSRIRQLVIHILFDTIIRDTKNIIIIEVMEESTLNHFGNVSHRFRFQSQGKETINRLRRSKEPRGETL